MATGAGAIGAAFIGRSAAIAEPANPTVTATEVRSFFIVYSARSGPLAGPPVHATPSRHIFQPETGYARGSLNAVLTETHRASALRGRCRQTQINKLEKLAQFNSLASTCVRKGVLH